jgi:hypothetical protein
MASIKSSSVRLVWRPMLVLERAATSALTLALDSRATFLSRLAELPAEPDPAGKRYNELQITSERNVLQFPMTAAMVTLTYIRHGANGDRLAL